MDRREIRTRGWRCPDEIQIAAFADGNLSADEREKLSKHIADCEYCLGQVAALAKLAEAAPVDVSGDLIARAVKLVPRGTPAGRSHGWRWAAAATAAAGLVFAIMPLLQKPVVTQPVAAKAEARAVRQAPSVASRPEIEFPSEGQAVGAQDLEFRWRGMDGALFYEVSVVTFEGDVVWHGQADNTHARLPATVVLAPGHRYYVSVSALLSQGKTVKSSTIGFNLAAGR
jgi:hypothetical protein